MNPPAALGGEGSDTAQVSFSAADVARPGDGPSDLQGAEDQAARAALAVEHARLYRKVQEANKQLDEQFQFTKAITDSLAGGIIAADQRGRISFVNPAAEQILGWTRSEILGQPLHEIVHGQAGTTGAGCRARCGLRNLGLLKSIVRNDDDVFTRKNGTTCPVAYTVSPILLGSQASGAIVSFQDMSERRRLDEQLARAWRLEAAGLVAGQVAHDLNNLLGPLVWNPELIKRQLPRDHPAVACCDAMLATAQRIVTINQNLLALGGRGQIEIEHLDFHEVVREALEQMSPHPTGLHVEVRLDRRTLPVRGSRAQLLRLVTNLLINAREAMNDCGTLLVHTENAAIDRQPGRYARLDVVDSGCGIPPDIRDKIFEPFFTTKRGGLHRGSGLGLSIVQLVVSDHHGCVDVQSTVGEGTTFSVWLPLASSLETAEEVDELPEGQEPVLVVDDDDTLREAIRHVLETLGYRAAAVGSGEEAVAFVREQPVDLVILDMVMPAGMDGVDAYRAILKVRPGQRAILMSGYAEARRVQEAQALGAGTFLRKPVTLARLARTVREALDGAIDVCCNAR